MDSSTSPSCVVCYEIITTSTKAVIKSCSHEFCLDCIKNWSQTNLSCPLCKQEFSVLQHSFKEDGTCVEEVLVTTSSTTPAPVEDQLNCLDHSYFLAEVVRLLQSAERVHKQMWLDGRSGRGLSMIEQRHLQIVEAVCVELRNHKRRVQALLQIDPHSLLQDLYRLQTMLDEVWQNPYDQQSHQSGASPVRYSADDAWDGNVDDDDEDLAEDLSYLSIGKNKQPVHTAGKTKALSKSKKSKAASQERAKLYR